MTQARIFISHGSSEKEQAQQIANSLEGLGVSTWLALRDVKAGQNFAQSIIDAIEGSTHLLVLMTESSVHSQHVKREVNHAVDQQKTLLPLFYGLNTDNQKALPSEWRYWLGIAQAIVWNDDQDPGEVIMPHLEGEQPNVITSPTLSSPSTLLTGSLSVFDVPNEVDVENAPVTEPLLRQAVRSMVNERDGTLVLHQDDNHMQGYTDDGTNFYLEWQVLSRVGSVDDIDSRQFESLLLKFGRQDDTYRSDVAWSIQTTEQYEEEQKRNTVPSHLVPAYQQLHNQFKRGTITKEQFEAKRQELRDLGNLDAAGVSSLYNASKTGGGSPAGHLSDASAYGPKAPTELSPTRQSEPDEGTPARSGVQDAGSRAKVSRNAVVLIAAVVITGLVLGIMSLTSQQEGVITEAPQLVSENQENETSLASPTQYEAPEGVDLVLDHMNEAFLIFTERKPENRSDVIRQLEDAGNQWKMARDILQVGISGVPESTTNRLLSSLNAAISSLDATATCVKVSDECDDVASDTSDKSRKVGLAVSKFYLYGSAEARDEFETKVGLSR